MPNRSARRGNDSQPDTGEQVATPQRADGGRNGICGFVYQAIVTLGMLVRVSRFSGHENDARELEALLTLIRPDGVMLEQYDQDIEIRRDMGLAGVSAALAQVKYSRLHAPAMIYEKEMRGIIRSLDKAVQRSEEYGTRPDALILITNRPLSEESRALDRVVVIEESMVSMPTSVGPPGQHAILVGPVGSMDRAKERLYDYGAQLGATRDEIAEGIDRLVAAMLRNVAEGVQSYITEANIKRAITGSPTARLLVPAEIAGYSHEKIEGSFAHPEHPDDQKLIRRSLLEELDEKALEHALIVVYGHGGCGKTATLWQWAYDKVTREPPDVSAFTALAKARTLSGHWVAQTLSEWAGIQWDDNPRRCAEDHQTALDRLSLANGHPAGTLLRLGVDGVDEDVLETDCETHLLQLLAWAWREERRDRRGESPKITLVVTCRDHADILDSRFGLVGAHGIMPATNPVAGVRVDDFSDTELAAAIAEYVPDAANSVLRHLSNIDRVGDIAIPAGAPIAMRLDDDVLAALRHPVMWGLLLRLPPNHRLLVLQGQEAAVEDLALGFVRRVYRKAAERGKVAGLRDDDFIAMLAELAHETQADRHHTQQEWNSVARRTGDLSQREARGLLHELNSTGLLSAEGVLWRWRHVIVWQSLKRRREREDAT